MTAVQMGNWESTHTLKAGVPLLPIASCKNKQHQPCQHWDLSLQTLRSDSHLGVTPTQAKTQTHSLQIHFANGGAWRLTAVRRHSVGCWYCKLMCPCLSPLSYSLLCTHSKTPPDRDTECYWQADFLVAIVSSPLNPSWRRWAVLTCETSVWEPLISDL